MAKIIPRPDLDPEPNRLTFECHTHLGDGTWLAKNLIDYLYNNDLAEWAGQTAEGVHMLVPHDLLVEEVLDRVRGVYDPDPHVDYIE